MHRFAPNANLVLWLDGRGCVKVVISTFLGWIAKVGTCVRGVRLKVATIVCYAVHVTMGPIYMPAEIDANCAVL